MEKCLRPERFVAEANAPDSCKKWKHWKYTFTKYLAKLPNITDSDKLDILCNLVDESVFEHISESGSYENAIVILQQVYAKTPNEIFARHLLHSCKQQAGESVDEYLQRLKVLSGDCNYVAVTAERCRDEAIRDAFITGISSSAMRQRLLEGRGDDLTLAAIIDKARSLENAYNDSAKYGATLLQPYSAVATDACQSTLKESKVVHAEASSCSAAARETKGLYTTHKQPK